MATKDTLTENRGWSWFPFDVVNWVTSRDILNMSSSEEGMYIRLLAFQWTYDSLPADPKQLGKLIGRDWRQVDGFLKKWGASLFPEALEISGDSSNSQEFPEGSRDSQRIPRVIRNQKLHFLAVTKGKFDGNVTNPETQKQTETETEKRQTATAVSESVLVSKTSSSPSQVMDPSPSKSGFDPLRFEEEIDPVPSEKYPRSETYPGDEVHRILLYHFKHNPSEYWTDPAKGNITSVPRLAKAINAMAEQVPDDWQVPAPKAPKTRTVGDPACKKCRGTGTVEERNGLDRYAVPCDCEKHEQIRVGIEWKDR